MCKVTPSWLERWKVRRNIASRTVSGESVSVTSDMTGAWLECTLPTLLSKYSLKDIYNADEFGLYFAAAPTTSLHFKNQSCKGEKFSKSRLTGLVAANAIGEKLPLLIIGKYKKPRCFKNVQNFPCKYLAQKKSWMDSEIFTNWLVALDHRFQKEKRNVLMIVDNCPAHPEITGLKNINLVFLPANTTSVLQPMDQGVIRSLKAYYRGSIVRRMISHLDEHACLPKINMLEAMQMATNAWESVTKATIVNCFRKCKICPSSQNEAIQDEGDPFADLADLIKNLEECDTGVSGDVSSEEFVTFDDDASVACPVLLTDSKIIELYDATVTTIDEEDTDDVIDLAGNDNEVEAPSKRMIMDAFKTLEDYMLFGKGTVSQNQSMQINLRQLKRNWERQCSSAMKQKTIPEMFSK